MSQPAQHRRQLALYAEVEGIVGAMRNLAQLELHRIERALPRYQQMLATIETALALCPPVASNPSEPCHDLSHAPSPIHLLLGSERGFCGGHNEQVVRHWCESMPASATRAVADPASSTDRANTTIVIGQRLASKLATTNIALTLPAPASIDDLQPCLYRILKALQTLVPGFDLPAHTRPLQVLSQQADGPAWTPLLPRPRVPLLQPAAHYLPLPQLYQQLQRAYLEQALSLQLLTSLRLENRQRLQQMEGAREHLQRLSHQLQQRMQAQRQADIIAEIAVILADSDQASA